MPLQPGAHLGSYVVVAPLGAGGMGEVYRARDTKLQRDVAIKVLPELFAADPERLARFEREALILASLNHPHIAHVYGLEHGALVMEFVDGDDLAARIAHGAIPLDEALPIARQIAEALEAAHEQGIIHRDLKPANIKVKDDGTVKMLDFGLAKALDAASSGQRPSGGPGGLPGLSMSPTMISPAQMTDAGIILGTAAYMAPEQAKERSVDKRADIWAFGCVFFEMLTGKPAFAGESVTETLASVMRDTPSLDALPSGTSRRIRRLLARCLERDPKQRLRDIGEARIELNARDTEPGAEILRPASTPRTVLTAAAIGVLAVGLAAAAAWRLKPVASVPLRKFDLALETSVAELSPDGSRIAYAVADHVFVRELAAATARDLGAVSQEITSVNWSPDSATVVTTSRDGKIRTIPARGGQPLVVCEIPESHLSIGLTWVGDEIVLAVWRGGLYRVDARGGTPKLWLAIDPQTEIDFHGLGALPDGRVVFGAHQHNDQYHIETFDGAKRSTLLSPMTAERFWYSPTGHLLFIRTDSNAGLWALPFGRAPLDIKQAFLIAPNVTKASVASDVTLMMFTGSDAVESYELIALNRGGQDAKVVGAAASGIAWPAISPDGRRVATSRKDGGREQVWVQDTSGASGIRLTFEDLDYAHPKWFPSGDRLLYNEHASSIVGGQLVSVAADGSGKRQPLVTAHQAAVSPDGRDLVYPIDERGAGRLRYAKLEPGGGVGTSPGQRVFNTDPEPDVRSFALSPDGRLLAYVDNKPGRADLLVTRYPTGEGRWQVVANGGRALWGSDDGLRWAKGTNELFFTVSGSDPEGGRLMAATVRADGASVTVGQPTALFEMAADALVGGFDVSPDGKTFFMRRLAAAQPKSAGRRVVLIQNWTTEFGGK
jgi:hypothetical protein